MFRQYLRLVEAAQDLQPFSGTVYHGSPTAGITKFDPTKRGSNTGDRDARQGFFFFGSERSAEGYLDRDEDLNPASRQKYDAWMAKAAGHKASYEAERASALTRAGIDPSTLNLTSDIWAYKLPPEIRDAFRGFDNANQEYGLYRHFTKMASDLSDESSNLTMVLNGAVYTCEIKLQSAYVADMEGAAYTAERYGRIINFARNNYQPDGLILRNVLDSEVGRRDTVFIVFEAENIEIVDQKLYQSVPADHRSY